MGGGGRARGWTRAMRLLVDPLRMGRSRLMGRARHDRFSRHLAELPSLGGGGRVGAALALVTIRGESACSRCRNEAPNMKICSTFNEVDMYRRVAAVPARAQSCPWAWG